MEKIKHFFTNLWPNIIRLFGKGKELKQNKPREFYFIASKTAFGLLLLIGMLLPLFVAKQLFNDVTVNVFDMPIGWIIFLVFLVLPFIFVIAALNGNEKLSKLSFKIHSIVAIAVFLFIILSWISVASDSSVTSVGPGFGFFIVCLAVIPMALLTWKPDVIMNPVYKIFKVQEIQEVEYVEQTQEQTAS